VYKYSTKYTWRNFVVDCLDFKGCVEKVDAVLAITNGGFFLGVVTAVKYGLPFYTIRATSYKGRKRGNLFVGKVPSNVYGKSVLLVDDILDTGKTIKGVEKKLRESGVNVKQKLVLFKREGVVCKCEYFRKIKKGIWIKFPWEDTL
jgi:hypoxanthine phosphoribosyltransferase